MKRVYLFIIGILMIVLPLQVNASSATISVSASDTVMVGNTVTVTVKLSSSSKIGSWQADLSYDKSYLQLTSSSAEAGGTAMANVVANGTKSKTYTFKFKALKNGNTKVSVSSYALFDYDTMEKMSTTSGSKSISIKTKEEIEASYSSNANLKSITVGEYTLSPVFNKDTLEYEVEVPNEIESVHVSASKEDSASTVTGTGDITLTEGTNKVTIVVTAQKGNTKEYVVNIYRKELDPINITLNGKEYSIVRRSDALPEFLTFTPKTTVLENTEVPALYSEITGYTLVGLKSGDGDVEMYLVSDGKVTTKYVEVKSNAVTLYPMELTNNELFKNYIKKDLEINGVKVQGYLLTENSKFAVIYAQDVDTGDITYYSYNIKENTAQVFDKELIENYEKKITNYKYVVLGLIGVIIILLFIVIVRKPRKKKSKKVETKAPELVKTIEEHIDNEIQDEVKEIELEEKEANEKEIEEKEIEEKKVDEKPKDYTDDEEFNEWRKAKREQERLNKKKKKNKDKDKDFDF